MRCTYGYLRAIFFSWEANCEFLTSMATLVEDLARNLTKDSLRRNKGCSCSYVYAYGYGQVMERVGSTLVRAKIYLSLLFVQ